MPFECIEAIATRENVVRLRFSHVVYFTGLGDRRDGARVALYAVDAIAGSVGLDDSAVWPVTVVTIEQTDASGKLIDVVVDRSFTPAPAEYKITLGALYSSELLDGGGDPTLLSGTTEFAFLGNSRRVDELSPHDPVPRRDFNTTRIAPESPDYLGVFGTDSSGDYSTDEGEKSLIKRLNRRTFSRRGAFLHLGDGYGLGVADQLKTLGTSATLALLRTDAEEQYKREPEVEKVKVIVELDTSAPNLLWFRRRIKTRRGAYLRSDVAVRF